MAEIVWTEPALSQLNDIAEYIALDDSVAAGHLVETVFSKAERLTAVSHSGRLPPEVPGSIYRELVLPPCRIFFRVEEQRVLILFMMRVEQQLRVFMLENQSNRIDNRKK